MNAPIENPFADYFSHLAASFGEDPNAIEVISKASALVGEKAREALLSMDYHCELHLTPAQMYDEKTIVLEQGYHYFIAEMSADQTAGNPIIPFFVQVEDNGNEVELSGGPNVLGQPALGRGMVYGFNFSQGYNHEILQEGRQFFRYVGNRGILKIKALQNENDNKTIGILITGYKICLSEV